MMIAPRLKSLLQICAIGVLLCSPVLGAHGQNLTVFSDSPQAYVVKQGDTLWDIASLFLDEPWRWPEIWQQNPAVQDPDLIYPGDVLNLIYVDGSPRIVMERGDRQVVRLSPQVRESPLPSPIPVIARQALSGFLAQNRIIEKADYDSAPYILASATDNLIMGAGHEAYVRGDWAGSVNHYQVFRLGEAYIDADTDEFLGQEAINLGELSIVADEGDGIKRALIVASKEELKAGDRLLPRENSPLDPNFFPSTPVNTMQGKVVGLLDNKGKAAQYETIVIDIGTRDGLKVGDILTIERSAAPVRDPISNKPVQLPATDIGIVLTYRTFEKLSYGVILSLTQPASMGDVVSAP